MEMYPQAAKTFRLAAKNVLGYGATGFKPTLTDELYGMLLRARNKRTKYYRYKKRNDIKKDKAHR